MILSKLPGRPDFVYRRSKVAIFVHGCWWHKCPVCNIPPPKTHVEYWRRKLDRNTERDRLNKNGLESLGWRVMEVWEHDVRENPGAVARKIKDIVASRTSLPFDSENL